MLLSDYIDRGSIIAPDKAAFISSKGEIQLTHRQLHDLSHRIAAQLITDGLQPGDRVAVFSPNDPLAFACLVGVMRAGGAWTTVNAANAEDDLVGFLSLTGCSRLFFHPKLTERAKPLIARLPSITWVMSMEELEEWMAPEGTVAPELHAADSSLALMLSTGGTTSAPKAVPVTHRQVTMMCLGFDAHLSEATPPRYLCATPMTHAAGGVAFPVLAQGGTVVVHDGFDPGDVLASIERNRVTRIFLPPTAVYGLLAHPDVTSRDLSSLRTFVVSASPISPDRLAEAVNAFGPVMVQLYGQSEAPFVCTVLSREDIFEAATNEEFRRHLSSCGRPSLIARVEIMGEDGTILGPEEKGEIVVQSDLVFGGYWQNPERTEEVKRPNGWHGTGDIGVRDTDGFIYVVDRQKDMIITGGFNVYPSEIENVIHTFPEVNDCAVIGVPDTKWGEAVMAVIEPKAGAEVDIERVIAVVKERLGSVKTPKQILIRTLPRSAVGKVLKRTLREEFWVGHERRV